MKNLNHTVENLDNFLYNLYINEETSKTELQDFLNNYINYILLKNKIQPESLNLHLHFIKTFGDCTTDFNCKNKTKKTHKLRNKENAHKKQNSQNAQTLAYIEFDADLKNINIYLNSKHCVINSLSDVTNLSVLISQLGHEVAHLIQHIYHLDNFDLCKNSYKQKLDTYKNMIKNCSDRQYIRKLSKRMHTHADNFGLLNSTEVGADLRTIQYFKALYDDIVNFTDEDNCYYSFLYDMYIDLELIQKCRNGYYQIRKKRNNAIKKSLVRDFNMSEKILEIP